MSARPEATGKNAGGISVGHNQDPPLELWLELQRLIPLREAARMLGLSVDTIKRRWPDKIVNPSERCSALRLVDLLKLSGAI
jgi:hypothetical protein